ncbi:hypothetical protein VIGAN_11146400 [Vigna angularis var. angularis]|uniref:Myb/SANT-like DNA-binding domain-containing protein n=1 Tax=Vigna angularis var. angularis TaxID=157739 RepID=A0A0S3TAP6_PHAAN|nr:uncharacterized protein LOC108343695 isoform X2 [Vigna angularis]BAU02051.1 hypothetical protein VIGAN_11146400 [Vigna angularis var. angularis]
MEGNLSQGGMVQGGSSFGGFDLPGSMRVHRQGHHPHSMNQHQTHPCQGPSVHSSVHDGFPLTMGTLQNCDQTMAMTEFSQGDRNKNSPSDESFAEEGVDGHQEGGRGKKGSPWQRVKWTDKMVRLLITAVSYIGEDAPSDCGGARRKITVLQKKGKWKSVSKVMAERGYRVSPQQCEDKFNDLNKRLHLPHDLELQRSLQLAHKNRDDHDSDDVRRSHHDDHDEDDLEVETDDHDDFEENYATHADSRGVYGEAGRPMKRSKPGQGHEDAATFGSALNSQEYNKSSYPHMVQSDVNQAAPEKMSSPWLQKQWVDSRSLQLEEQKLQIQVEMLELEKQRFKWQKFSKKKDRELEKLKLENERMKLENERIALELKRKGVGADFN